MVFLKKFFYDSETLYRFLSVLFRNALRISGIFSKYFVCITFPERRPPQRDRIGRAHPESTQTGHWPLPLIKPASQTFSQNLSLTQSESRFQICDRKFPALALVGSLISHSFVCHYLQARADWSVHIARVWPHHAVFNFFSLRNEENSFVWHWLDLDESRLPPRKEPTRRCTVRTLWPKHREKRYYF